LGITRHSGWNETKRDGRRIDLAHVICKYATIRISAKLAVPQRNAKQLMLAIGVSGDQLGLSRPYDFSDDFSQWWSTF
jgi:hypothetical protein